MAVTFGVSSYIISCTVTLILCIFEHLPSIITLLSHESVDGLQMIIGINNLTFSLLLNRMVKSF